tara:strand:+ start:247 stop:525 length:279 start_codon:yes stop_codon:yes gene_type:complete
MFLGMINWWISISGSAINMIKLCCSKNRLQNTMSLITSSASLYSLDWLESQINICKGPDDSRNASGQWGHFLDVEMLEDKKEHYVYGTQVPV